MSDSMWKKDLSFKRTPKADGDAAADAVVEGAPEQVTAEPEAPKQSMLKKEISFGRKPKAPKEDPVEQPEGLVLPPTSEKQQSFLKKEISFGAQAEGAEGGSGGAARGARVCRRRPRSSSRS